MNDVVKDFALFSHPLKDMRSIYLNGMIYMFEGTETQFSN